MIYCLVTEVHAYTWRSFLRTWGSDFAGRMSVVPYGTILGKKRNWDRHGCYLFCDLDRLTLSARETLARLHAELRDLCGAERVLNDPLHSLLRYDLLRTMHAVGINEFAVRRVNAHDVPAKFPLFLRSRHHQDASPVLITDAAAYRSAVGELQRTGVPLDSLLAVDFCDVADRGGVYRKYGAFVVGESIVPRHLFFGRQWVLRQADLEAPELLAEELAYLEANPHREALQRIARIAGVEYGRIDYGVLEGRPQVWEINTNPMIASRISAQIAARRDVHLGFLAMFARALEALDAPAVRAPA